MVGQSMHWRSRNGALNLVWRASCVASDVSVFEEARFIRLLGEFPNLARLEFQQ